MSYTSNPRLSNARKWLGQFPPFEWAGGQLRELAMGALRQGPIPQHVAFVMDGNRRFARSQHIETVEGHNLGFEALARVLEVCYKSGVRVVSIYAFSIENFQRPKHEVEGLMALAKLKLTQLAQHGDLLSRYGARIRILGQRELIRPDVLEVVQRVEALTQDNGDAVLNVCFPYTARDEMTTAVRRVVAEWAEPSPGRERERAFSPSHISHTIRSRELGAAAEAAATGSDPDHDHDVAAATAPAPAARSPPATTSPYSDGEDSSAPTLSSTSTLHAAATPPLAMLDPEAIDVAALNARMHTAGMPPLDLLVRTSGVCRFSDFMLWQAHENTEVAFVDCLWPDFDLWNFLPILVEWQWRRRREARGEDRARRSMRRRVKVA